MKYSQLKPEEIKNLIHQQNVPFHTTIDSKTIFYSDVNLHYQNFFFWHSSSEPPGGTEKQQRAFLHVHLIFRVMISPFTMVDKGTNCVVCC